MIGTYEPTKQTIGAAGLDFQVVDVRYKMVTDAYTPDLANDTSLADVPDAEVLQTSDPVGGLTWSGGQLTGNSPVPLPDDGGHEGERGWALVAYAEDGSGNTYLLTYSDGIAQVAPRVAADGGDDVILIENALEVELPAGTDITFSGGAQATLATTAHPGERALHVDPLGTAIATTETGESEQLADLPLWSDGADDEIDLSGPIYQIR